MNRGHDMSASQPVLSLSHSQWQISFSRPYCLYVRLPLWKENLAGFDGKAAVKRISNSPKWREVWSIGVDRQIQSPAVECVFLYWLVPQLFFRLFVWSIKRQKIVKQYPSQVCSEQCDISRLLVLSHRQSQLKRDLFGITRKLTANANMWEARTNESLFIFIR